MNKNSVIKLVATNVGFAVAGIALFPHFVFDLALPLATAACCSGGALYAASFVYLNMSALQPKRKLILEQNDIVDLNDLKRLVNELPTKCFAEQRDALDLQLERVDTKYHTLQNLLLEYFDSGEVTYQKYILTINDALDVFGSNVKSAINHINIFDYTDYKRCKKANDVPKSYKEHIKIVDKCVKTNNQIINYFDNLILEVMKLHDSGLALDVSPTFAGLQELIETTKYYEK